MMMDFTSIKDTVERAKIKAAAAAKKLSLNELAANDEYIHSEGLKISGRTCKSAKLNNTTRSTEKSANDVNSSNYMTSSTVRNNVSHNTRSEVMSQNKNKNIRQGDGIIPNHDDGHVSHYNHNNKKDDDDDSIDSLDEECDPILHMVKTERGNSSTSCSKGVIVNNMNKHYYDHNNSKDVMSSLISVPKPSASSLTKLTISTAAAPVTSPLQHKKDPNRFMADLDARLAAPLNYNNHNNDEETPSPPPSSSTSSIADNNQENFQPNDNYDVYNNSNNNTSSSLLKSFTLSDNKIDWLRNTITISSSSPTKKIQKSFQNVLKFSTLTPINNDNMNDIEMANQNQKQQQSKVIKTLNGENINVITSSSLALNNQENEELQRLMNKTIANHHHGSFYDFVIMSKNTIGLWIEKHRHYSIIVLTFILTTLGYLYTRKKIDENT